MCVVSSKHKNICLVMRELYGLDNGIHYKFYGLYLCVFEHAIIVVLDIMSTRYWPFVALVKHTRLHDSRYTWKFHRKRLKAAANGNSCLQIISLRCISHQSKKFSFIIEQTPNIHLNIFGNFKYLNLLVHHFISYGWNKQANKISKKEKELCRTKQYILFEWWIFQQKRIFQQKMAHVSGINRSELI